VPVGGPPALLTTMSSRPSFSAAAATVRLMSSWEARRAPLLCRSRSLSPLRRRPGSPRCANRSSRARPRSPAPWRSPYRSPCSHRRRGRRALPGPGPSFVPPALAGTIVAAPERWRFVDACRRSRLYCGHNRIRGRRSPRRFASGLLADGAQESKAKPVRGRRCPATVSLVLRRVGETREVRSPA